MGACQGNVISGELELVFNIIKWNKNIHSLVIFDLEHLNTLHADDTAFSI